MMPTPSGVLESEGHTVIASGLAAATGSASLEATLSSRRRYALPESVSGSVSMRIPAPIPIAMPITTPVRWNLLQGLPECHRTSAGPGAARFAVVAHRNALAPADVPSRSRFNQPVLRRLTQAISNDSLGIPIFSSVIPEF